MENEDSDVWSCECFISKTTAQNSDDIWDKLSTQFQEYVLLKGQK
jgi:hypothetical protein